MIIVWTDASVRSTIGHRHIDIDQVSARKCVVDYGKYQYTEIATKTPPSTANGESLQISLLSSD